MAYLTPDEYIARFGTRETILITNETAGGQTFDSGKVENAISDAAEIVDGYIGPRYVVPVVSAPRILKGWVAALAREKLYIAAGRVSDAVKTDADNARKDLLNVQAGKMSLPLPEGSDPLPVSGSGTPQSSMDRPAPVFANTGVLQGYLPSTGMGCVPNWRRGL